MCKNNLVTFHYFTFLFLSGRLYALQKSMEIDKKSPEARQFLGALMDYLEKVSSHSFSNFIYFI